MPTALAPHRFEVPRYSNHDFDQVAQRAVEIREATNPSGVGYSKESLAQAQAEWDAFRRGGR